MLPGVSPGSRQQIMEQRRREKYGEIKKEGKKLTDVASEINVYNPSVRTRGGGCSVLQMCGESDTHGSSLDDREE